MTRPASWVLIAGISLAAVTVTPASEPAASERAVSVISNATAGQPSAMVRFDRAIRFRRQFGLRMERDFVRSLVWRTDLGRSAAEFGTPLTPAEEAEMHRRVRQMHALPRLGRFLVRRDREHFAGIYTDQRRGGIVHLALTPGAQVSRAEIARRLPYPSRLRIARARYSKAALDEVFRRIRRDLKTLAARGITVTQAHTDVRANRVAISVDGGHSAAARALRGYGPGLELKIPASQTQARSHPSGIGVIEPPEDTPPVGQLLYDPFPPMYAGLDVRSPGDTRGCTSGFNQIDVPTDTHYALAAAFCSELGESVWHGDHVLGTVDRLATRHPYSESDFGVYHDAARVPLDRIWRSNRVWIDEGNAAGEHWRPITESTQADYLHVGDPVCKSGIGSGFECGTVEQTDVTLQCISGCAQGETYSFDQTVANLTYESGDANYPVFLGNSALGQGTGLVVNLEELARAGDDGVITPQELDAATEGASFAPIANVESDLGTSTYVGQSHLEELLRDYTPELRYDLQENYFADSAATMTDNVYREDDGDLVCNRLKNGSDNVIVDACGDGGEHDLGLDFLDSPTYKNGSPSSDDHYVDAEGDLLASARRMHSDIAYRDRIYGRIVNDATGATGLIWLQYWFFYYNNDRAVLGFGEHEGDWEGIQVGLDPVSLDPREALYLRHGFPERCQWEWVEKTGPGDTNPDRPVVYVAPASHASYYFAGKHNIKHNVPDETANGNGIHVVPEVSLFSGYDSWVRWQGRWGGSKKTGIPVLSKADGLSPQGPAHQDDWYPERAVATSDPCTAGPLRTEGETATRTDSSSRTVGELLSVQPINRSGEVAVKYAIDNAWQQRVGGPADLWVTVFPRGELPVTYKRLVRNSRGEIRLPVNVDDVSDRIVASVVFRDGFRTRLVADKLR